MTLEQLEKRVSDLEKKVAALERLDVPPVCTSVDDTFGMFSDDPDFEEVVRLGEEYRRQANAEDR
jgi:hypothetical protein